MKSIQFGLFFLALTAISACAPKQPGRAYNPAVVFANGRNQAEVVDMELNGKLIKFQNVKEGTAILPGFYRYEVRAMRITSEGLDCATYQELDKDNFDQCEADMLSFECDPCEYSRLLRDCKYKTIVYRCKGTFTAYAGSRYEVLADVTPDADLTLEIYSANRSGELSSKSAAESFGCSVSGAGSVHKTTQLGYGREELAQHGFSCPG